MKNGNEICTKEKNRARGETMNGTTKTCPHLLRHKTMQNIETCEKNTGKHCS